MIKVGFDISQLAHYGGVATYTQNLAAQLEQEEDLELTFFYSSLRRPYRGNLKNVKKFKLPPTFFEILFNKLRNVPIERFVGEIDIFHSSDWIQPPSRARKVTTYHDVVPIKYPQWSNSKIIEVHKRRLAIVEKEIDMVIAVSETTKKDLLEISSIPEEKITVIYEGVDKIFAPQSKTKVEAFRKKYRLAEKFILAIGGIGERRNLTAIKDAAQGHKLVITRQTLPDISRSELPLLYSAAEVLLYPSFYEGFGLPILEAMASGTPVITSDLGAMKEIAGDCAVLVDPNNIDEIRQAIGRVLTDKKLQEKLIKDGIKNAKKFSWEQCVEETVKVYQKVMTL